LIEKEGYKIIPRGKKYQVADFEKYLFKGEGNKPELAPGISKRQVEKLLLNNWGGK